MEDVKLDLPSTKDDFSLINYDGINLFWRGKWTGVYYNSITEGKEIIKFLIGLPESKIEQFIKKEKK